MPEQAPQAKQEHVGNILWQMAESQQGSIAEVLLWAYQAGRADAARDILLKPEWDAHDEALDMLTQSRGIAALEGLLPDNDVEDV